MEGYELKNYLYLDIETLPSGFPDIDNLKTEADFLKEAPKSYSKDKQLEWAKNKTESQLKERDEDFRKKALDSLQGRLFCIGMAYNDEEPQMVKYCESERLMMEDFYNKLSAIDKGRNIAITTFVGHNVKKFDIRWLVQRAYKYEMKDLLRFLPTGKFDKRIQDTNDLFNLEVYGQYSKLDDIAKFFGLEGKTEGMDGSQVYDYFLANRYEEIYEYCTQDVKITREIHKMMIL
jgi:3'-5' exonuclease